MVKKNILIVNSSSIYGGGEYFVLKLSAELKYRNYNVLAGCKKDSILLQKLKAQNTETVEIDFPENGSGNLWKNVSRIKNIIKEKNIDIIHSNTGYDRTAAAFAARGTKAKHITSCHSLESLSHNLTHFVRNKLYTNHFIADGESIKRLITTKNKIPASKVTVVHNGIDPDEMKRNNELRKKVRYEFNIAENDIVIGGVGRLVEFKGFKYLLTAFKIIREKNTNTKLLIVGDGELRPILNEQANSLGVSDSVIFTGFRDDLQSVYSAFDIYTNTSIEGGGELFPFTILYAMAQGLPIVAAKVGDIPAMIIDGLNGFLIDEKSPFQAADKIGQLLQNPDLRTSLGNESLNRLQNEFTLDKMVAKISEIYENA